MILGDAGVDTDEYDESVIVHEWGHYLPDRSYRATTVLADRHGGGDLLDMRVAFSEGWANAYSGSGDRRGTPISDTSGSSAGRRIRYLS